MYTDPIQWSKIRNRILSGRATIRQTVRETGISRETVRKMIDYPVPPPFGRREWASPKLEQHKSSIQRWVAENESLPPRARLSVREMHTNLVEQGDPSVVYSTVRDYAKSLTGPDEHIWELVYDTIQSLETSRAIQFLHALSRADPPIISSARVAKFYRVASRLGEAVTKQDARTERRLKEKEWLRAILQKDAKSDVFRRDLNGMENREDFSAKLYKGILSERNRSLVIISKLCGITRTSTQEFLGLSKTTYKRYTRLYEEGGYDLLFAKKGRSSSKFNDEDVKKTIFRILHEPPSQYGINRTSWIMRDLIRVLKETGCSVCPEVVRKITRAAGYRWRKARIVLTSQDPTYRDKLSAVQAILSNLGTDEAFFSIDEFGPFAVKMKQGLMLDPPGPHRVVPQWQRSKGCMIMTAALELSGNQVTHFYSDRKNTTEMIRMMEVLLDRYADRRTLYLSWDAASWHISKKLKERIGKHNATAEENGQPRVEIAPLPAGAQFLNVIESVFSGMARAVIHNSNYPTVDAARAAIDRYFADRNQQFRENPKRAGKHIWGKERVPATFSDSNNCKDPNWR